MTTNLIGWKIRAKLGGEVILGSISAVAFNPDDQSFFLLVNTPLGFVSVRHGDVDSLWEPEVDITNVDAK